MTGALLLTQGQAYNNRFLLNLLLGHDFGLYKNFGPTSLLMHPHAMKASVTHDPNTPRLHEAMLLKDEIAFSGSPCSLTVLPAFGIKTRQSVPTGTGSKKYMASKKTLSWAKIVKK
jgi:hypothetical protein